MVKVEDKLGEFTGGFFRIEIDDKDVKGDKIEFELRPTQKHKRKLLFNYKQIQELTQLHEKTVNDHKVTDEYDKRHNDTSERLHTDQNDFVTDILKTSYPDFNVEQVEGIMMRYDTELLS